MASHHAHVHVHCLTAVKSGVRWGRARRRQTGDQRLCRTCMHVTSLVSEAGMRAAKPFCCWAAEGASTETIKCMPRWEARQAPSEGA